MVSASFTDLIDQYSKKVYKLAYNIVGNKEDAEDVVQETFIQVYKHLDDFRGDSNVYTWIYRIAVNQCFQLKKQRDKAYVQDLEDKIDLYKDKLPFQTQAGYSSPENAAIINELTKIIRNECHRIVMQKLPEKQKVVFVLRVILDLTYQETSDILGIPENVIKSRLHRARINLINHFQNKCQWYMQGESGSCCQKKIGYILTQDAEALKRVYEEMKDFGTNNANLDVSEQEIKYMEQIFRYFPLAEPSAELINSYILGK